MSRFETTAPKLRPHQEQSLREELSKVEDILNAPPHILNQIQDRGELYRRQRRLTSQLNEQAPSRYEGEKIDQAIKRAKELEDKFVPGMLTQREMRRNPPGAVDRNRKWAAKHKDDVLEYKNIQLRLAASGCGDHLPDSMDIANIERLRPHKNSQEADLSAAQIQTKDFYGTDTADSVVLTDEDLEILKIYNSNLHSKVALMNPEQRRQVKELLSSVREEVQPKKRGPNKYNLLQQEARELGINSFGMKADEIEAAIAQKKEG